MGLGNCGEETTLPIGIVLRLAIDKMCKHPRCVLEIHLENKYIQIEITFPEILHTYKCKLAKTNCHFLPYYLVPMSVLRIHSVDEYCISREPTLAQRVSIGELSSTNLSN